MPLPFIDGSPPVAPEDDGSIVVAPTSNASRSAQHSLSPPARVGFFGIVMKEGVRRTSPPVRKNAIDWRLACRGKKCLTPSIPMANLAENASDAATRLPPTQACRPVQPIHSKARLHASSPISNKSAMKYGAWMPCNEPMRGRAWPCRCGTRHVTGRCDLQATAAGKRSRSGRKIDCGFTGSTALRISPGVGLADAWAGACSTAMERAEAKHPPQTTLSALLWR
ncbi:hypothetical protein PMI40_03228 [Herbaspirillum sp. YR522]|nr:hypothetical protein PMI40_03228 [Herbaspirillum sp. YR522]